jgi:RNA 3'-terminal phosphate cyclase (ATP)
LIKRGTASQGGGEVSVSISPLKEKLRCISLRERGEIIGFKGEVFIAKQEYETVILASKLLLMK